jgi:hypothetical protein
MITFLFLVVMDSFGLFSFRLSSDAWLLLQIRLGGYIVGRSGEDEIAYIRRTIIFMICRIMKLGSKFLITAIPQL